MKNTLLILASLVMLAGIGCAALSELVTPATIDPRAVAYAESAGVADANDFDGWPNLEKALRLQGAIDAAHEVKSLALAQMAEKNELDYGILKGVVSKNLKAARDREEQLFGETGLLSTGLTALGAGAFAGLLGLMRKRPGDITPQEMESVVAEVKGEVADKDRQIIETVKGIQRFIDKYRDSDSTLIAADLVSDLKDILGGTQSAETKQAVAVVKTTLS
jgi:hypothetical protein